MGTNHPLYWAGKPPSQCNLCSTPIVEVFYDINLGGPWGNVGPCCVGEHIRKLGPGLGQRFEKQPDGKWLKTGG